MTWSLSVKYHWYCLSAFQRMAFVIACFEITDVYYINEIGLPRCEMFNAVATKAASSLLSLSSINPWLMITAQITVQ